MPPLTCVVTIHGIGFQQPPVIDPDNPQRQIPGYADQLHTLLRQTGGLTSLGDDPERLKFGVKGPVYVQSPWNEPANGLGRLAPNRPLAVDHDGKPLENGIAHVAVVYSGLDAIGPRLGSTFDTVARVAWNFGAYAHPLSAAHMLAADLGAMLHPHPVVGQAPSVSLQPRRDLPAASASQPPPSHLHLMDMVHRVAPGAATGGGTLSPTSHLNLFTTLEHDIASYICRNDLRERLRDFIQLVLTRLAERDDVGKIVINAHSQGAIVAVDALGRYAPTKIRRLVTAGSPLRKYVDLFAWGNHVGELQKIATKDFWHNVYDPFDPVADPLVVQQGWQPGKAIDAQTAAPLMRCPITDQPVDNVANSGGGLAAHNYWGNARQFIPYLADVIKNA